MHSTVSQSRRHTAHALWLPAIALALAYWVHTRHRGDGDHPPFGGRRHWCA